jgi:phosphoglucomutase
MEIATIRTAPIAGQKPGTSGLRKKTRVFMETISWRTTSRASLTGSGGRRARPSWWGATGATSTTGRRR